MAYSAIEAFASSPGKAEGLGSEGDGGTGRAALGRSLFGGARFLSRPLRPTIAQRVVMVGAIPITIMALVGFLSILLLGRADAARSGALDVSTIYRQVVSGMSAQDAYVNANPADRNRYASVFSASVTGASAGFANITARARDEGEADAIRATVSSLDRYGRLMGQLTGATVRNDQLVAEMDDRLQTLISLTDEARERQHSANLDVIATLKERNAALLATSRLVDGQQTLRAAISDGALTRVSGRSSAEASLAASFEIARIQNAFEQLVAATKDAPSTRIAEAPLTAAQTRNLDIVSARASLDGLDRQIKIDSSAQRALQGELSQLFSYSVEANETEQATQKIALDTLKLGQRAREVISRRQSAVITDIIAESHSLGDEIAALPISPLIQTDMLDALDFWREALGATQKGLREQNQMLVSMSDAAGVLLLQVSALNSSLSANADRIGSTVRQIIVFGGGMGFLLASLAGILVARSITGPLKRLEHGMIDRASRTGSGLMPDAERGDEVGAMACATNQFLTELDKRENALRSAKERTEETLQRLRDTQSELIQAEKLASLGQLVAGVAHEINTPLGVALTTATVMVSDVGRFEIEIAEKGVTQEAFQRFVTRMAEGSRLTAANVERSANLVHSFKQVAADQASGERRTFRLDEFTGDLFTSLGPMGKRAGHKLTVICEPGIEIDSYPGALAQVLTNLLANAYAHAFDEGEIGEIDVKIGRRGFKRVRIAFTDNGRGIGRENRSKVFDPFFTTGRAKGSTGLGLHIVYNLVTATLGGMISLQSQAPGGSTFTIDLPVEAPMPASKEQTSVERAAS